MVDHYNFPIVFRSWTWSIRMDDVWLLLLCSCSCSSCWLAPINSTRRHPIVVAMAAVVVIYNKQLSVDKTNAINNISNKNNNCNCNFNFNCNCNFNCSPCLLCLRNVITTCCCCCCCSWFQKEILNFWSPSAGLIFLVDHYANMIVFLYYTCIWRVCD